MTITNRTAITVWSCLWLALLTLFITPISSTITRVCFLVVIIGLWALPLVIFWKVFIVRLGLCLFALGVIGILLLPGGSGDPAYLRAAYVDALHRYEGVKYVWGGESHHGIDCSGLIRSALIDANLSEGIHSRNPRLLRQALAIWWSDCSARELGLGYGGRTNLVNTYRSINETDLSLINPGDLAVTEDGVHILAYLGNESWIEASPERNRVVIEGLPQPANHWFTTPVRIMRWTQLS